MGDDAIPAVLCGHQIPVMDTRRILSMNHIHTCSVSQDGMANIERMSETVHFDESLLGVWMGGLRW